LHHQQHGKDKQNIEFPHPAKVSADAHASDLNFIQNYGIFRHFLVVSYLQIQQKKHL